MLAGSSFGASRPAASAAICAAAICPWRSAISPVLGGARRAGRRDRSCHQRRRGAGRGSERWLAGSTAAQSACAATSPACRARSPGPLRRHQDRVVELNGFEIRRHRAPERIDGLDPSACRHIAGDEITVLAAAEDARRRPASSDSGSSSTTRAFSRRRIIEAAMQARSCKGQGSGTGNGRIIISRSPGKGREALFEGSSSLACQPLPERRRFRWQDPAASPNQAR